MPNANALEEAIAELDYVLRSPGEFTRPGNREQIENARDAIVWMLKNRKNLNELSAPDEVQEEK